MRLLSIAFVSAFSLLAMGNSTLLNASFIAEGQRGYRSNQLAYDPYAKENNVDSFYQQEEEIEGPQGQDNWSNIYETPEEQELENEAN